MDCLDGWTWKHSFAKLQREQRDINARIKSLRETTHITTLESWISLAPTERWPDRLVYGQLEVHAAFFFELDGRPMQVPACVVSTGQTNFEFFETREQLYRVLRSRDSSIHVSFAHDKSTESLNVIHEWVTEFAETHCNVACRKALQIENALFYQIKRTPASPEETMSITNRIRSGPNSRFANCGFPGDHFNFFYNKDMLFETLRKVFH